MKERVTVDFDTEGYYLDGKYWCSWDDFGEQMAEEINKLLHKENKQAKNLLELLKIQTRNKTKLADFLKQSNGFSSTQLRSIYHRPAYFSFHEKMNTKYTRNNKRYLFI